jgi:PAS domain S-box-containing protein
MDDSIRFDADSALSQLDEIAVLREFLANAPTFVVIKDAEGRYVYLNRFVAASYRRSDLLGKTAYDLLPPDVADATRAKELDVLRSGTSQQTREVFPALDGALISASLLRFAVDTPSQRLLGVLGLDVTELMRAEQRQAALLDLATDAIHVRDLVGCITYWNRAAERLYGWTAAEVQGRNALEILFRQDAQSAAAIAKIQQHLLIEKAWSGELTKVTRRGAEITVASRWTLLADHTGQPDALLVIDSDITERKRVEQQLVRAVRMDTIGSLAGSVAHDLNNMLMPILMGAAVIRKRVNDPQLARTIDHLEESAKKAADLVRQILTFIRGAADATEAIEADKILKELRIFLQATFPPSLHVQYAADNPLSAVLCRPSELHQVLVNLCVNARDAMGERGALTIEARNVLIDEAYARMSTAGAAAGRYVAFSVIDTGEGIPADQLQTIFEPYFTTKEPGKGTGLGLSNAATVVRALDGFITVESELGKGSAFTIFLPAADGIVNTSERTDEMPAGAGETILVVDDEGAVLQVIRETLETFGYRVIAASDGSEAIALLTTESDTVRLIVSDISMPIVDGIALAKFVRRAHSNVKIVIAAGSNDQRRHEAMNHSNAYLQKPYTAAALLRVVATLLLPDSEFST